ncbi:peptidoglycan-binding domain-containing protein [Streptomyces albireticuli]|uniref:peptidoglycan-binding domain-containing protein n=1 Tax=Streptomyces albireticuli TaxID=1940 RepID=UPI00367A8878
MQGTKIKVMGHLAAAAVVVPLAVVGVSGEASARDSGSGLIAADAQASPGIADIGLGSTDWKAVICVQKGINAWASRTGKGTPIDEEKEEFGKQTYTEEIDQWVRKLQHAYDLPEDGIVGPNTGDALLEELTNVRDWRWVCYDRIPSTHR